MKTKEDRNRESGEIKMKEEQNNTRRAAEVGDVQELNSEEAVQVTGGGAEHRAPTHVTIQCEVCGVFYETVVTGDETKLRVCPKCRGYFTGQLKPEDPGGRISRYRKRFHGN